MITKLLDAMYSTGRWHVYYPNWMVCPPKMNWIGGFWGLIFWSCVPMVSVVGGMWIWFSLATPAQLEHADGILLLTLYLFGWSLCFGKWFEKCYGCWHEFGWEDREDDVKRHWCATWVNLTGGLLILWHVVYFITFPYSLFGG